MEANRYNKKQNKFYVKYQTSVHKKQIESEFNLNNVTVNVVAKFLKAVIVTNN